MKLKDRISILFCLSLVLLLITVQTAVASNVTVENLNNKISGNSFAEFLVKIENTDNFTKEYSLDFGIRPQWSIITQPLYTLELGPGESGSFHVYVKAKSEMPSDHYVIPFTVESDDEKISETLYITYGDIPESEQAYKPTVKMFVTVEPSYSIDPREPFRFKLILNNYNVLNLSDLRVIIFGAGLNIEKSISLGPLETRKNYYIDAQIDPHTSPGKKDITVALDKDGKIIATDDDLVIDVLPYNDTQINVNKTQKHLIIRKEITILNNGNQQLNFRYKVKTNYFRNLFIKTSPDAYTLKEDGNLYLAWDVALAPKENTKIVIVENYLSLVIILVLIALIVLGYFLFRSPIVCEKKVQIEKTESETKIKTKIIVKNRSNKQIKDLVIKELVPPILSVKLIKQIGILGPSKVIQHEKKGTLLEWKIDVLEPLEERIIIYRSTTKLSIIGELLLKSTLVKYKVGNKERITKSNSVITQI